MLTWLLQSLHWLVLRKRTCITEVVGSIRMYPKRRGAAACVCSLPCDCSHGVTASQCAQLGLQRAACMSCTAHALTRRCRQGCTTPALGIVMVPYLVWSGVRCMCHLYAAQSALDTGLPLRGKYSLFLVSILASNPSLLKSTAVSCCWRRMAASFYPCKGKVGEWSLCIPFVKLLGDLSRWKALYRVQTHPLINLLYFIWATHESWKTKAGTFSLQTGLAADTKPWP